MFSRSILIALSLAFAAQATVLPPRWGLHDERQAAPTTIATSTATGSPVKVYTAHKVVHTVIDEEPYLVDTTVEEVWTQSAAGASTSEVAAPAGPTALGFFPA